MKHWTTVSHTCEDTNALAADLAPHLRPGDTIALVGELGAGKTQFVAGLARGLKLDPTQVASPTYVIMHVYEPPAGDRLGLVHLDAYRLMSLDDLESIGWDDVAKMFEQAIVVVEWADRIADELPSDHLLVTLEHLGDHQRKITLTGRGDWSKRLAAVARNLPGLIEAPMKQDAIDCKICGEPVSPDAPTFPFCSQRCRMADLGNWLGERYRISRPVEQRDLEEGVD